MSQQPLNNRKQTLPEKQAKQLMAFEPMLAHDFVLDRPLLREGMLQPKIDGIRAYTIFDRNSNELYLMSRQKNVFTALPEIERQLKVLYESNNIGSQVIFDGELYVPGLKFHQMTSWIKRNTPKSGYEDKVKYIIFDMYDENDPYLKSEHRLLFLEREIRHVKNELGNVIPNIESIPSHLFENIEQVEKLHEYYTKEKGHEGVMLRKLGVPYYKGRTYSLLKYKLRKQEWFKIVNVIEGEKKFEGAAIFVCVTDQRVYFNCVLNTTLEELQQIYSNKEQYNGKYLLVDFLEYTTKGAVREPKGLKISNQPG